MPKDLDDCVQAIITNPDFKPQEGKTKEESAYAICQEKLGKSCPACEIKKETNPEKRTIFIPLLKKDNKYIAVLSDNSIDRDEEIMSESLINDFAKKDSIMALINHSNTMESWAGGFKNMRVDKKEFDGMTHTMLTADFIPLESNPHTSWITKAIDEAVNKGLPTPGLSVGAIPFEYDTIKIGNKEIKRWTKAELCESSFVPYGSNRNAVIRIAKSAKDFGLIIGGEFMQEEELNKKFSEFSTKFSDIESKMEALSKELGSVKDSLIQKKPEEKKPEPPKTETVEKQPQLKKEEVIVKNAEVINDSEELTMKKLIQKAYNIKEDKQ